MQKSERKHPKAVCESCPLFEDGAFVPSEVPNNPKLAIVGEAPGFYETSHGRPFMGPSGKLLNQVLNHYEYPRSEVMYTNVCLCRPENNATPPKAAVDACRPRLLAELAEAAVRDVVALGGTAASVLVDDSRSISRLRVGPPKQPTTALRESSVERVVTSWHPAYCLRNSDAFPALVSDIGKLKDSNRDAWAPPAWKYFEEPQLAIAALEALMDWQDQEGQYKLVVDIETGLEKDLVFDHPNNYDLLCVGLAYTKRKAIVIGEQALKDSKVIELLKKLFLRSKLIAHNGKFDLAGLYPKFGPLSLWADTMLGSYCLDERPGNHGLKVRAVETLGAPQYDLEIHQYVPRGGNYANIPRAILYKYNAYDVSCTWDLWEWEEARLNEPVKDWPYPDRPVKTLRDVHDFMVAASNELMYLELNGITIDRAYQNQLRGEFLTKLEGIEDEINSIVNKPVEADHPDIRKLGFFNPRSPKQIKEYLFENGITVDSTNQDTMEHLRDKLIAHGVDSGHDVLRFINTLLVHRRQQKLYSTYVEGIRKRTYRGRVYTTYMLHGTTSGRLASRNPNLQNIVRDKAIRKQFGVAKPENVLIQADFKQAEGRVIATLAQDEYLKSIFSDPDIDLFNELSDQLYGPGNWAKEERIRTKAFFYGLSYGREAYSIAMEHRMSVSEAEQLLHEFMSLIPATAEWQRKVRNGVLDGKDLITPFGRRRRFWLITEENQKDVLNEALSFLPQSTASDICLGAFTRLRPALRGLGFIRLTIHDALVAECHESKKEEVIRILAEEMSAAGKRFTDYVPFPVDISIGRSWGDL